jgi:hypothetical protein
MGTRLEAGDPGLIDLREPSSPPHPRSTLVSSVSPAHVGRALLVSIVLLTVANAAVVVADAVLGPGRLHGVGRLFDVRREGNLPTWWSSLALLVCAGLLWAIGRAEGRGSRPAWPWVVLALVFAYLSLDEAASIHELASRPLRVRLGLDGALHFAWVVPAAMAVLTLALVLRRFVLELPPSFRRRCLVAAAVYVTGALGAELVEALAVSSGEDEGVWFDVLGAVEEGLEMVGIAIFVMALVRRLSELVGTWTVRLGR